LLCIDVNICVCFFNVVLLHVVECNIVSVADCYERIAIGQRLISSDVLRSTNSQQVKDCEKECDVDLDKCSSFDFG